MFGGRFWGALCAGVVESADTGDLKSPGRKAVRVRVPVPANLIGGTAMALLRSSRIQGVALVAAAAVVFFCGMFAGRFLWPLRFAPREERVAISSDLPAQGETAHSMDLKSLLDERAGNTSGSLYGFPHAISSDVGDFDGDAQADRVAGVGLRFQVHLSSRSGPLEQYFGNSSNSCVGFDDVDRDGCLDVWRSDGGDGYIQVFFGDGTGRIAAKQVLRIPGVGAARFLDVNGDGARELVVQIHNPSSEGKRQLRVLSLKPSSR